MRIPKLLLPTAVLLYLLALSCKKMDYGPTPASLTVIHAMPQGKALITILGDSLAIPNAIQAKSVAFGSTVAYSPIARTTPFYMVQSTDTSRALVRGALALSPGKIFSLFVAGDTAKPDAVLLEDNIPVHQDSSGGLRVINLSRASQPVNVNIKGNGAAKTEFSGIAYKQASNFKDFKGTKANSLTGSYIFEVRNQANDSLLLTYTWSFGLYKNYTLVLAGSVNASGKPTSLKIFPVNHF